jgi:hypothetical protein
MEREDALAVYNMACSKGWEEVEKFINSNVKALENEVLQNCPETLEEVKACIKSRLALLSIINFVEKRVKTITEGGNK